MDRTPWLIATRCLSAALCLTAAAPLRAATTTDCYPACRAGFVCAKGVCVSACNPPCAANETCSAVGECVRPSASNTIAPANDPKERRQQMAWTAYAGLGGSLYHVETNDTLPGYPNDKTTSPTGIFFTGGFGMRRHFTRILGYQARGGLTLSTGDGTVVGLVADATLRLGPVGNAFPWYVGVGPEMGYVAAWHEDASTDFGNGSQVKARRFGSGFLVGGVIETGFVFGEDDAIDVGFRWYTATVGLQIPSLRGAVTLGVRLGTPER